MMSISQDNLIRYVRAFERVRRRRRLLAAIAYAIGIACLALTLITALQRRYPLPPWAVFVSLIGVILPIVALWEYFSRVDLVAAAGEIERREIGFEQKLQTVVSQLLTAPRLRASAELVERLAEDLQARVKDQSAASLVSMRPVIRGFVLALIAASVLGVIASNKSFKSVSLVASTMPAKPQAPVVAASAPATAPALIEMRVEVKYPAYMSKTPVVLTAENVEAPVGSELLVSIGTDRAVMDATLETEGAVIATTPQSAGVRVAKIVVSKDAIYRMKMSESPEVVKELKIRAIVDAPPSLTIVRPRGDAMAGEMFEIAFDVGDDFGLARASADVTISSAKNGQTRAMQVPVDVSPLKVSMPAMGARAGDVVTLTMQARDSAGQVSLAQTRRIIAASKSRPLVATLPNAELREANQASQALVKALELVAPQLEPNVPRTSLGRALAGADETSRTLQAGLTRLVSASSSDVIAGLNDSTQVVCENVRQMRERLGVGNPAETEKPRLAEFIKASQQLNQQFTTLSRGVNAAMLQAQLKPRERAAMAMARGEMSGMKGALRSAAARAPTLAPLAQELGLDPTAADLFAQAGAIVAQGEQLARSFQPPSAFALAQQWIPATLMNASEAMRIERRLASVMHFSPPALAQRVEVSPPIAATQPINLDQAPPNYREAIAVYFQTLARDAAAAPAK